MKTQTVLVLGSSDKPERYSYKAAIQLQKYGHNPILLGNKQGKVGDMNILTTLPLPYPKIDTITLYLNPERQKSYYNLILDLQPKRIIMNPGTENEELATLASQKGIEIIEGCTLAMLSIGNF
ncbi:MAG: CoA-binding protein [Bacteroidia bacterium]|nr:CoA-binding protein [Bacteroidia bacterium]MDW8347547.1 CoA-binding protein [Bacteroidia bacterium]